jgi:hypothetical protein
VLVERIAWRGSWRTGGGQTHVALGCLGPLLRGPAGSSPGPACRLSRPRQDATPGGRSRCKGQFREAEGDSAVDGECQGCPESPGNCLARGGSPPEEGQTPVGEDA